MSKQTSNKYVSIFGKYKHYFSYIYVDDKAKMICKSQDLQLEQLFIQQQHDQNFRHLC